MIQQMQLSPSPLAIERHEFTSIQLEAAAVENPTGELKIKTRRSLAKDVENPSHWKLTLTVEFGPNNAEEPAAYAGVITIVGSFHIAQGYPDDRHQALINVTAASILYGACREMVANLTARSTHGLLSLPSISFAPAPDPIENKPEASKKRIDSKRTKKKAVRKK
jgi:preprotein translocase subunit SecB